MRVTNCVPVRQSPRVSGTSDFADVPCRGVDRAILAAVASLPLASLAGPLILEPDATLSVPDPSYSFIEDVAVAGDAAVIAASKQVPSPEGFPQTIQAAFLYERDDAGDWSYVTTLIEQPDQDDFPIPISVAMEPGIVAINLGDLSDTLRVFERTASGWVAQPATGRAEGTDIVVDSGSIFASTGTCSWDAQQYDGLNQSEWTLTRTFAGIFRGCDDDFRGGDIDAEGAELIIAQPNSEDPSFEGAAYIYVLGSTSPSILTSPAGPTSPFGASVAIGNGAWVTGTETSGVYHFLNIVGEGWTHVHTLLTPDALLAGFPGELATDFQFILHNRSDGVAVYQYFGSYGPGTDPQFVAVLDGIRKADIWNNRVVGIDVDRVSVFDLPEDFTQPAPRPYDFQDGDASDWAPQVGSDYAVVPGATSMVYRQSALTGNAISLLTDSDWTNQSVQADVTPTAFDGNDRWFGLIARYTDANNYYYVTARRSNVIQIRKIVNGAFQSLASATLPVTLNRTYNLRLEAIGTLLRLYVDGALTLEVRDTAHSHGQAGLMTYKARADYDNIIVSPHRLMTLLADDFENGTSLWTPRSGSWGIVNDGTGVYAQLSSSGTPRVVTGIATGDQILRMRIKPTGFSSTNGWFGVMARYVDDANYYYITARNNGTISLRKLVNGAIHVLDTAPLTVTTGTWYTVRVEAVGTTLRAYVNGKLLLEANDTSIPEGRYGLVTYRATAHYDDVQVVQP